MRIEPSRHGGPFSEEMAGDVLLPGADARLASMTFDELLQRQAADPAEREPLGGD